MPVGQRRLHQDGVDRLVGIEPRDQRQRLVQRRRVVEPEQLGAAPGVADRLDLVADVDFGGGILPGQHHAQPRGPAVALAERGNARRDLLANAAPHTPHRPIVAPPGYPFSPDAFVKPKPTSPHGDRDGEELQAERVGLFGRDAQAQRLDLAPLRGRLVGDAELGHEAEQRDADGVEDQQQAERR